MPLGDGVHEFVDETHRPWKPDYQDLLGRMAGGFERCTEDTCQLWTEDGTCEWWENDE
jgi:hypothetical protein